MKKLIFLFTLCTLLTPQLIYSQWYQQQVPVSKPITGIKFIDSLKGWACTNLDSLLDTGYILHTTNGGVNWLIQYQLYNSQFLALSIIDSMYGYTAGYNFQAGGPFVYKTTNGGTNWFNLNASLGADANDLFFLNRDSGYVNCGFIGADVRTTTDGGNTWLLRTNGFTARTNRLFFLNYNTGWCGAMGYLFKTTNAGINWFLLYDNIQQIYSILFMNETTGWIGIFNKQIKYTTDGGNNWINQVLPSMAVTSVFDIKMINDSILFAGQKDYFIFKSQNRGENWGYQNDSTYSTTISFADSLHGWTGDIGISHTSNSGGPIFYVGFVPNGNNVPAIFRLYQNYPNPFNPYTTIKIDISRNSTINLLITDILGRQRYLVKDQYLNAGTYAFNWDSRNESSGIYFYTLVSDNYRDSKKMVLVK